MRDCASALPFVLRNIELMAGLHEQAAVIFVENDSRDDTRAIAQAWCAEKPNATLLNLDGLAQTHPVRTIRLAAARNAYLAEVKARFPDYDHLIVVDCDDSNAQALDADAVQGAIAFLHAAPERAGVFANQDGPYYDLWALRHPERCPGDVWEEVLDCAAGERVPDQVAFDRTFAKRIFSLPADAPPMEVDSAFGGLGIYKIGSILKNRRKFVGHKMKVIPTTEGPMMEIGWQVCEHVAFNAGFRERGERLFVIPSLINRSIHGIQFPPSAFRSMIFDPKLVLAQKTGTSKIGRNDPCPCGSGKRFKHCHGR